MDVDNELSDEQMAALKTALVALINELKAFNEAAEEGAGPVDLDLPIGRLSRMDAMQQAKVAEAGRRNSQRRLRFAEQAMRDFKTGHYGICKNCEDPIAYRRLQIRPESALCVRCQGALGG